MIEKQVHPQNASFQLLFPKPDADISDATLFSRQFRELWGDRFKESALSFIGLTAKSPDYDHRQAELSGNDYACTLHAHFKKQGQDSTELKISLGRPPLPRSKRRVCPAGKSILFAYGPVPGKKDK